ncbi:MAG: Rrf2 family transcriptional regulator [Actinomycetota bacterium]|nr:Rrf2 family transcriptional regulator [Actinomycetota bacterium]
MKLSEGVEWGLHCALLLAEAPARVPLPRRVLAEHYGLPEAYLAKHLQALARAGLLHATPGPSGGFRLARPAGEITVLDVLDAIEGAASPFICQEIRQQGTGAARPEECTRPCAIASVMVRAHQAWRESLRAVTLDQLVKRVPQTLRKRNRAKFASNPST